MQQNKTKLQIALVLIIVLALTFAFLKRSESVPFDKSKYQAVFLTDGQVYFGKLGNYNEGYALLNDVYYLKFSEGLQQARTSAESSPQLNLIKLGGEAHGPEGQMYISKAQILFIENLKEGSAVAQAINRQNK